jgi:transcriptional regulator GlxA family with amidase domain
MSLINVAVPDNTERLRVVASELELVNRHGGQVAACLLVHPRLRKLLEYLELNPSRRLSTTDAAKIACFQKNYFCAFFKRETGCSFISWQRTWRAARIAEVLLSDNISITHAAERYGYLNIRAFERAFKEVYRVSAREFRREYRADTTATESRRRKSIR